MEKNNISEKSYILHAYAFDSKGSGAKITNEKTISEKLKADELAWVHLDANHSETRAWLQQNVNYLDHIILDALLAEETRPRIMEHEGGMLIILRGVNLNEGMDPEDMISIRVWIDQHRIISLQRRPLKAIQDMCTNLENGKGAKDAPDFIVRLTTRLFQRMEPVIITLDERTDTIEESILENPDLNDRHDIVDIRIKAIMLKRHIAPQKDVIGHLRNSEIGWFENIHKRALQENQDRLNRYIEDLDAIRERAQIVKDELANIMADRMNKNMYVLSIVAGIFLPLGFLTGLLGINVGGMPGAENDMAFWIVCLLCAAFGFGMIGFFRLMKWL